MHVANVPAFDQRPAIVFGVVVITPNADTLKTAVQVDCLGDGKRCQIDGSINPCRNWRRGVAEQRQKENGVHAGSLADAVARVDA